LEALFLELNRSVASLYKATCAFHRLAEYLNPILEMKAIAAVYIIQIFTIILILNHHDFFMVVYIALKDFSFIIITQNIS